MRPRAIPDNGTWELFSILEGAGTRRSAVPVYVRFIADAFVTLQPARHAADYDHTASFPKAVARTHVRTSERAVALIDQHLGSSRYLERYLVMTLARCGRLRR